MSYGPTKYPSKHACIYCGKAGYLLTNEHVVPLSIGGKHVIEKASCVVCATITGRFEQDVARGLWGEARASYGAPTRRKKERAKFFLLKDPKGVEEDLRVPVEQYPAPMVFYKMPTAGILAGVDPSVNRLAQWELVAIADDKRLKDFHSKHPGRLRSRLKNVPDSFGRMLAKIGYCQVLTVLDPDDFNPICLPYILGKKSNISYVVGSDPINRPPQNEFDYFLRTVEISTDDRTILVVEIRLFANSATPNYHVVVGEVIGRENVERITVKLSAAEISERPDELSYQNGFPWIPQIWPLKP